MSRSDDFEPLPENLDGVADALSGMRPVLEPEQLDRIKQRAMDGGRQRSSRDWGVMRRSRLVVVLTAAVLGVGAASAVAGIFIAGTDSASQNQSAAKAQYKECTPVNLRWHYSANNSSGSWSGTEDASCAGEPTNSRSVAFQQQAMEGDLKVMPGATVKVGFDLTMPGNSATHEVSVTEAVVAFKEVHCVSGAQPSKSEFTVPIPNQHFVVTNSEWYGTGEQSSELAYQASIVVPNVCNGGEVRLDKGALFTATVTVT